MGTSARIRIHAKEESVVEQRSAAPLALVLSVHVTAPQAVQSALRLNRVTMVTHAPTRIDVRMERVSVKALLVALMSV